MNENNKKKREWVKNAAIIFLTVMLLLTFFSNTIMNYSLPEVAAQYVQSGSITAKIRGNGIVESGDPYNLMVKQTRKVMSVAVKEGDQVQAGDVILYLEDGDSEELKVALDALELAQNAYNAELLKEDVNAEIINNAQSNISTNTFRKQIEAAQAEVDKAQADVDYWQEQYDAYTVQLTLTPSNGADVTKETEAVNKAKKELDKAQFALTEAENEVKRIEDKIALLPTDDNNDSTDTESTDNSSGGADVSGGGTGESDVDGNLTDSGENTSGESERERLEAELQAAKTAEAEADNVLREKQLVYDKKLAALENKQTSGDNTNTIKSLTEQRNLAQVNLDAVTKTLEKKQQALSELTADINKTLTLETLYDAVTEAQKLVDEEATKTTDAVVTADIAGTIIQINAVAGKEVSAAEAVAIIQPEGQGYTMSFTVSNDQAKRLSVGDKAELINSWYYDEMDITLKSIRPDTANPSKQKLLVFDVSGSVTAGQSLNVSVGQKSANYDLIVPNSAIREDNNGKFVLVVESKSSPLGNRYIATRVDVEVLASDDTQSAITGALYGWEFVITTSTKPVEAGQQVRLAEN